MPGVDKISLKRIFYNGEHALPGPVPHPYNSDQMSTYQYSIKAGDRTVGAAGVTAADRSKPHPAAAFLRLQLEDDALKAVDLAEVLRCLLQRVVFVPGGAVRCTALLPDDSTAVKAAFAAVGFRWMMGRFMCIDRADFVRRLGEEGGGVDFSGMHHFWHLFATLWSDREPDPAEWEALFATPGYAALTESEFEEEFFIEKFRLAFKPSLREHLLAVLEEESDPYLQHYQKVRRFPGRVRRQQAALASDGGILQQAVDRCLPLLPDGIVDGEPPVSFVIFACDARGYTPVVIDVLASARLQDFMTAFLAHEFHHYYREPIRAFDPDAAGAQLQDVLWVLEQINAEGVADLIDKPSLMAAGHPVVADFAEEVHKAPAYLTMMDEILAAVHTGQLDWQQAGEKLRSRLLQSGHPVGFYMAQKMMESCGRELIVEVAADPFVFIFRFSQLMERRGERFLCQESLEALRTLRRKTQLAVGEAGGR